MKSIAILSIAGLAAAASAQGISVDFSASATEINVGDTVTWTVSVTATGYGPTAYFGGFVGSFLSSDNTLGLASNMITFMNGEALPPVADGADVTTINVFNSALLGTDDQSIGVFYQFDVTATAEGALSYTAAGTWSQFADDGIFSLPDEFTAPPITSDTVNIVPAPGALALLGLGGLTATRRRR
ncbi:MAG TPA: PEP-CTERM sorting domain-containing protein [Phycisphaerales bacterium]|nr:PEP-CTERM sorting domain-containing protein [Phycisphaerales bacterium]